MCVHDGPLQTYSTVLLMLLCIAYNFIGCIYKEGVSFMLQT